MATNCLGPFLFAQLLLSCLEATARDSSPGSVRVVWTSSQIMELSSPKGGFAMTGITAPPADKNKNYVVSKTGNWFLASELARRQTAEEDDAIVSIAYNPGGLSTNLLRHALMMKFFGCASTSPAATGRLHWSIGRSSS